MNEPFSTRVRNGFSLGCNPSVSAFGVTAPETALARIARTRVGVLRA